MVSPALFGLLPLPGGALMSAPIVDQIDPTLDPNYKIGINVWYRHALILIYPLSSSLIVGSILSGISLYIIVIAMIVPFFAMTFIGYITIVRSIEKEKETHDRNLKVVFRNLIPIIIAPLVDFFGRTFIPFMYPELFLLIGLCVSIWIALKISRLSLSNLKEINQRTRLWRFPLLIFAMFLFLDVFKKSGVPEEISALQLPFIVFMCFGFFLGFATGRVQLPISILIPIYLIQHAIIAMPLLDFVLTYFATFLGYIITPLHPCLAYNINYFKTSYKHAVKVLIIPTFICFGMLLAFHSFSMFILSLS